jgi:RNA polymerase sigma factor for flagellar operon FliA
VAVENSLENLFLQLLPRIDRAIAWQVRRYRMSPADADDFAQWVKLKFVDNDYAVLRKFEERSSVATYVTSVVANAFQDFRNHLWGKWRPSAEARRLGAVAVLLEQYVVRDELTFDEASVQLTTNHSLDMPRTEIERIAAQLPPRTRRRMEPEAVLQGIAAPGSADAGVWEEERAGIGRRIWTTLDRELGTLTAEDAAILALKYKGGKKVSEIATILGLSQKPLYRRIEGLQRQLRVALEADGLDHSVIREFLDDEQ